MRQRWDHRVAGDIGPFAAQDRCRHRIRHWEDNGRPTLAGSAGAVQAAFPGLPIRVRIERQLMREVQCTYRPFLRLKLSEMLAEAPFARIAAALLPR